MSKSVANVALYFDSHRRVDDFAPRVESLEFSPRQWELLSLLDGRRSAAEIAARMSVPSEVLWYQLCKFERMGLVVQQRQSCPWDAIEVSPQKTGEPTASPLPAMTLGRSAPETEASPRTGAASGGPVLLKLAGRTKSAAALPQTAALATPAPEAPKPSGAVQLCLGRSRPPAAAPAVGTRVLAPPPVTEASKEGRAVPVRSEEDKEPPKAREASQADASAWPIKPVLDALRMKAEGDALVSQLLAYRVFLRVPSQLLEESGIRSISLIDPELKLRSQALKEALAQSLLEVTGLTWPGTS